MWHPKFLQRPANHGSLSETHSGSANSRPRKSLRPHRRSCPTRIFLGDAARRVKKKPQCTVMYIVPPGSAAPAPRRLRPATSAGVVALWVPRYSRPCSSSSRHRQLPQPLTSPTDGRPNCEISVGSVGRLSTHTQQQGRVTLAPPSRKGTLSLDDHQEQPGKKHEEGGREGLQNQKGKEGATTAKGNIFTDFHC